MANEFSEINFGKYEFDADMVADFLNIMSEETETLNNTHEIGVESAELNFEKRLATAGGPRTEKFLKDFKISESVLFDLIELCANKELIQIYKKNEVPQILDGIDHDHKEHIHFFSVQEAGKKFIANHKK